MSSQFVYFVLSGKVEGGQVPIANSLLASRQVDLFVVSRKIWSLGRSSAASARDCALPFQKAGMDCEDLLSSSSKSA